MLNKALLQAIIFASQIGHHKEQVPASHPATTTSEYIESLKLKAQQKRDRKAQKKDTEL